MKSRLAVLLFFAIALAAVTGREPRPQDNTDVKVDVDLTRTDVLVLDKSKQPVSNLTKDDFLIFENDAEQEIKYLNKYSAGIMVVIAIDLSSSMNSKSLDEGYANHMPAARQAGLEILKHLSAEDEVSLVLFDHRIIAASKFTSDFDAMAKTISEAKETSGDTDIHLGVMEAAEKLARGNNSKRSVIFLISDNQSSMKAQIPAEQILRLVAEKNIVFYNVPVTIPEIRDPHDAAGRMLIHNLIEKTGGGA
ncbi:MAG: VWA domain-containing protein, partial [bacterium]|nr:VWA domain-containing protein [bacterium]